MKGADIDGEAKVDKDFAMIPKGFTNEFPRKD